MRRPSFPTVISLLSLFVALGGTSYAVIKLPANSVGSREIKPNAVSSGDIRNGSVASKDLAPSARGQRGPRGPQGPPGQAGSAGDGTASPAAVEPWKPLAFAADWSNYSTGASAYLVAQYRKDQQGRVHLRGLVKKDVGVPVADDVIATLPPGYRPSGRTVFAVAGGDALDKYGRADVLANGDIHFIIGGTTEADFTSLDTISFWTD